MKKKQIIERKNKNKNKKYLNKTIEEERKMNTSHSPSEIKL